MCPQMLQANSRHRYELAAAGLEACCDIALFVGVLPDSETRTRRPPRVEDLCVWTGPGTYPLKEVEDQSFNGFRHKRLQEARDVCSARLYRRRKS